MDKEQITQLVIDELVGDITPEDAAMLSEIITKDPAAAAFRIDIIRLLTEGDMKGVLDEKISLERALTNLEKGKSKKNKPSFPGPGTLIITLIIIATTVLFYKQWQQTSTLKASAALQASIYKYPLLMFEDGSFIRMDQVNDNKIANLSFDMQHHTAFIYGAINQFEKATLITARGQDYQLVLSDGSTLYIAPKTSVTFFLGHTAPLREIAISGQAFIEVAHDPQRPFIANLPQTGRVKVLGTSFNINTEDQKSVQVALKEGSVKVETGSASVLLEPGYAASWQKGSVIHTMEFNEDTVLLWRQGRYLCSGATLRDLADAMERCYPYPVSIDIPPSADTSHFFTGELARDRPIKEFLETAIDFVSEEKFEYIFDKDSTLHISLKHGPSTKHR